MRKRNLVIAGVAITACTLGLGMCGLKNAEVQAQPTMAPTATVYPTYFDEVGTSPAPTEIPRATVTPIKAKPTVTLVPTVKVEPTATPVPTATVAPTATPSPVPTATATPTPSPEPTATPVPTATVAPTATPVPTATPKPTATPTPVAESKADGEVWNKVVENLINAGVAEEVNDYYSNGLSGEEKPKTTWTFFNGNKDAKFKDTDLVTESKMVIDSTHKESLGLPTQYGITIADVDKKVNRDLAPNAVIGIINKTTGEFIFTTVCNDDFYRKLSYGKTQFGKNLEFANGDSGMVCSKMVLRAGKYDSRIAWDADTTDCFYDFQIRFDEAINTEDYTFFVTSCDMETWLANEDWYYDNSYTVVDDFYGNIDRMHTEGADIQFWEIKNDWDY